jgi:hypothetical protein
MLDQVWVPEVNRPALSNGPGRFLVGFDEALFAGSLAHRFL